MTGTPLASLALVFERYEDVARWIVRMIRVRSTRDHAAPLSRGCFAQYGPNWPE